MNKVKLVCFDVDGTLVDGNSWLKIAEGLGIDPEKNAKLYKDAFEGRTTFAEAEILLRDLLLSSGNANKQYITKILEGIDVRTEGTEVVKYLMERGYPVFLVSGAIDQYVEIIAKKLGVTGYYSNSAFEYDENETLNKIQYVDPQGLLKLEQIRELMKKYNLKKDEISLVGDGMNDMEVFKYTGKGIAVKTGEKALRDIAWKVVDNLTEIKNIL